MWGLFLGVWTSCWERSTVRLKLAGFAAPGERRPNRVTNRPADYPACRLRFGVGDAYFRLMNTNAMFGWFVSDGYLLFALPGLLLGLYAQFKLRSTYARYTQVAATTGVSGAEAAREILDDADLGGMPVQEVQGHLTDHYDPMKKALFLSSENYHGRSLAALGVAAHEAGHALQHKAAYVPMQMRMAMVPVTQFASTAVFWIFMLGMFLNLAKLAVFALVAYAVIAFFQLVTLPVEFDASRRAKVQLLKLGLIRREEHRGVSKVLNAAALTYVAAMVASMFELLRLILIVRSQDRG